MLRSVRNRGFLPSRIVLTTTFYFQVSQSPIAAAMAMQYTLQTCKAKDKIGLMRVLGILAQNIRGHPFEVLREMS